MHRKLLAAAASAALVVIVAAPAAAQVTGIVTRSDADMRLRDRGTGNIKVQTVSGKIIEGKSGSQTFGSGGSFASTSITSPDYIYFKNGNAGTGNQSTLVSTTLVDITFKNDSETDTVTPQLKSQIVPAGFGIFVGPRTCPNDPSGCNPNDPLTGNPTRTFDDFDYAGALIAGQTEYVLASASFSFRIYANSWVAYELTGDLSLVLDTETGIRTLYENIGDAQAKLIGGKGFRRESEIGSRDFLGYQWDTTDILVDFKPGTTLAPGASATLTYETIVQSTTNSNCFGNPRPGCLISYASFGDPVGRGGGTEGLSAGLLSAASSLSELTAPSALSSVGTDPDGLLFGQFAFIIPTFKDGVLTYVLDESYVPEPDNWALMIAGFGLVGATMRRRRRLVA